MNRWKQWIAILLCALLAAGTFAVPAYAEEGVLTESPAEEETDAETPGGTEVSGGEGQNMIPQEQDGSGSIENGSDIPDVTTGGEPVEEDTEIVISEDGSETLIPGNGSEILISDDASGITPIPEQKEAAADGSGKDTEDETGEDEGSAPEEEAEKAEGSKSDEENAEEEAEEAEEDAELEETAALKIEYRTHIQNIGWESSWKGNGQNSGTTGRSLRLEGIQIRLKDAGKDDYIEYRTHVQNIGWESSWKRNGETSGTTGRSLRLEAIQIRLSPALAEKYDIYYCVHAQDYGWLGWAKNGDPAGSEGHSKRLEAIRIQIVSKGSTAPARVGSTDVAFLSYMLTYQTHVQDYGWLGWVKDYNTGGTTGLAKRLEGVRIKVNPNAYAGSVSGSVEYRTHIQNIGWESDWKSDGEMSGTEGRSLRLEAIQIRLTGELAEKYDVYYRTHIQNFGWLGWAKNGETAGSEGLSLRMEALQIVLVPQGGGSPGTTAGAVHKSMNKWNIPYAQPNNGNRTLKNLLRTALVPCGRTLWVWGGGHGPDANIMGMPQSWENYFVTHSTPGYQGRMEEVAFYKGPDCSGYMNWVLANTAYTPSNRTGLVLLAEDVARVYSSYGWTRLSGPSDQVYKPGDIVCMDYGHVWISLGQYEDGSVILVHNSTKGVQISGTGGIAHQRAGYYMQKYFPYWPYPAMLVDWYKGFMNKGRWITNGSGLLTDPDGIQNMKPDQVLELLLGP